MIPTKVLNRLLLGRPVASEVSGDHVDYRAWVYVEPRVIAAGDAYDNPDYGLEPRMSSSKSELMGFVIRFIKLHNKYLAYPSDLDRAWEDPLTTDLRFEAADQVELERVLSQWLSDYTLLHPPSNVGYPSLPRRPRWKLETSDRRS